MAEDGEVKNVMNEQGVQNMLDLFMQDTEEVTKKVTGKDAAAARQAMKQNKGKGKGKKGKKKDKKVDELSDENEVPEEVVGEKESVVETKVGGHAFLPHTDMPVCTKPCEYLICGVCKGPPEFCSYMSKWNECKVWIEENHPEYLPESVDSKHLIKKKAAVVVPTGPKNITIQKMKKGAKIITKVEGLQTYGISLTHASKLFRKKFAAASTVQKDAAGVSYVEIQGDMTLKFQDHDVLEELYPDLDIDMNTVTFASAGKIRVKK